MARFAELAPGAQYLVVWRNRYGGAVSTETDGRAAMDREWPAGAEAWRAKPEERTLYGSELFAAGLADEVAS